MTPETDKNKLFSSVKSVKSVVKNFSETGGAPVNHELGHRYTLASGMKACVLR